MKRVWLIAGETSGDRLGAGIVAALRTEFPGLEARGVIGPAMAAAAVMPLATIDGLAAVGLWEGVKVAPRALRLLRRLRDLLRQAPPDVVITIDAPTLNRRVGRLARRAGVPVVHVVAPQVWAWRAGRAERVGEWCSALACLFPFEPALFADADVDAVFVGHPALEAMRAVRQAAGPILFAPGSRPSELRRMLPTFREVRRQLDRLGHRDVVWLQAPGVTLPVADLVVSDLASVRPAAALATSGTVTLELAARGIPLAVAYRTDRLSAALAPHLLRTPWVALPNVLAGRGVVPEHLQDPHAGVLALQLSALTGDLGTEQAAALSRVLPRHEPGATSAAIAQLAARHARPNSG